MDDVEGGRYHVGGEYMGHFRATEKNNCDMNPTNCTGHVADFVSYDRVGFWFLIHPEYVSLIEHLELDTIALRMGFLPCGPNSSS